MYFDTDWTRRVDFDRMRADRLRRLRAQMRHHQLDAVVAFKFENTRYVSGLRPLWFPISLLRSAAITTAGDDAPVLCYVTAGDWEHRRETMYWLPKEHVRPLVNYQLEEASTVREGLAGICDAVRELGAEGGRVGIDQVTIPVLEALGGMLPTTTIVDANECFFDARFVKTEDELALFRMASQAVDQGLDAGIRAVRPGRRECEVLADVMHTFYSLGMEIPQCSLIVSSGENLAPLQRFAGDRPIRDGDLVFMDVGGCFNGIFAEATRVVACGTPNETQRRVYHAVYAGQRAVFGAIKPGVTSTEVCEALMRSYHEHGMGEYAHDGPIGHGIGAAGIEPPTLGPGKMMGKEAVFQEGMALSIEPTLIVHGVPGGAGIRLEDEIIVTHDGCEVVTRAPYDERLLA